MCKRMLLAVLLVVLFGSMSALAQGLTVLTENNPPFNFIRDDYVVGIGTDLLVEMGSRSGVTIDRNAIKIYPWARAYEEALHNENTLIYSMGRMANREELFQWVGPFFDFRVCIFARRGAGVTIDNLREDVKKYRIGTVREDGAEHILLEKGIRKESLDRIHNLKLNIQKLKTGRLDGVAYLEPGFLYTLKSLGELSNDYEVVHVLASFDLYFGLSKKTDPSTSEKLQKALESIREDGTLDLIIGRYI